MLGLENNLEDSLFNFDLIIHQSIIYPTLFPYGPFINSDYLYLGKPKRKYFPKLNRNLIGVENRKRTIIYQ